MKNDVAFKDELLNASGLLVDKVYKGGRRANSSDDPLNILIGVSNQGGFRIIGRKEAPRLIVLSSNLKDTDWPDNINKENGIFTYFGDNKTPGHELHDTPRYGNHLLKYIFEKSHGSQVERVLVPPILIFTNTGIYRDVEFLGLAVPGAQDLNSNDDLVALWKLKGGKRFQNYKAKLTILDVEFISKAWLNDVKAGNPLSNNCPDVWRLWVETRIFRPLKAQRTIQYRNKEEQLPSDEAGIQIIKTIQEFFKVFPTKFEVCAAEIAKMMLKDIISIDITRPVRDGGRDAIGKFRIGEGESSVLVDFALEAKCYELENPVAVKELSRLISRLRHRQFGILVTTSYVARQAYQELKEDEHPIVVISAIDIVKVLKFRGLSNPDHLQSWLSTFNG